MSATKTTATETNDGWVGRDKDEPLAAPGTPLWVVETNALKKARKSLEELQTAATQVGWEPDVPPGDEAVKLQGQIRQLDDLILDKEHRLDELDDELGVLRGDLVEARAGQAELEVLVEIGDADKHQLTKARNTVETLTSKIHTLTAGLEQLADSIGPLEDHRKQLLQQLREVRAAEYSPLLLELFSGLAKHVREAVILAHRIRRTRKDAEREGIRDNLLPGVYAPRSIALTLISQMGEGLVGPVP